MVLDFDRMDDGADLTTDVCVIGAGAAGITVALEFAGPGHDVLVLVGGGPQHEAEAQRLNESEVVGLAHRSIHEGRARVLGGATTLWAGQALPLDDIDFRVRDWVPDSGWPLSRAELEPFYRRAERWMHLGPMTYDERSWPPTRLAPPPFDRSKLRPMVSQFSPRPDFRVAYRADLERAGNVRVLLRAHATEVLTNESATAVERVEVRSLAGKTGSVRARAYVVCCGGIDTARLLLASNRVEPNGVGNRHDLVGRYFQDHPHQNIAQCAVIVPRDRKALPATFDTCYHNGIKYAPKIASSVDWQERHRLLNVAGDLCYEAPEDSAVEAAKLLRRALRRRDRGTSGASCRARPGTRRSGRASWPRRPTGTSSRSRRWPTAAARSTSACRSSSGPTRRAASGSATSATPSGCAGRAVLDWRLTGMELRTIEAFVGTVAGEFERLGIGTIDLATLALPDDPGRLDRYAHDGSHHMGTARMHDDPRRGVVDHHCRVHGVENLFVGSSAVFPTGGFSNPTLTILALCARLCDHLKQNVLAGAAVSHV